MKSQLLLHGCVRQDRPRWGCDLDDAHVFASMRMRQ